MTKVKGKEKYIAPKVEVGREKFSFLKGYNKMSVSDAPVLKAEIMKSLGLTTRVSWYARLYGKVEPKITEYQSIEKIFAKYGIKNCWGV